RIFWSGDDDHRQRRILAAAVWETDGSGNPARGLGRATEFVAREASAMFSFRLLIPHEGPVSYKGQLTGIVWKLRVRVEQPGFDEFAESVFHVVPRHRGAP